MILGPRQNVVVMAQQQVSQLLSQDAQNYTIKQFDIPTSGSGPNAIVSAPNNTFWFVEFHAGKIGEFLASNNSFREFRVPENGSNPTSLAIDHDGKVWFSDQNSSGSIWELNPIGGSFTRYKTKTPNSTPLFILIDNRNNVWFTELTGNNLGELTYPGYTQSEFPIPTSGGGPAELALQSNSSTIWLTETYSGKIAKFDMNSHAFVEYSPSISLLSPVGIVLDKTGNVWVSEHGGSSITELIPSNSTFRKYPTSVPSASGAYSNSAPATLAIDALGRLLFVEHFLNKVGRLDPNTGNIDEFPIPGFGAYSVLSALDSSGNFWFTQYYANRIGMISSNTTSPLDVLGRSISSLTVQAGQTTTAQFSVQDRLSTPIRVQLNATSSFTPTGQTSIQQVSFNETALNLNPGQTAWVTATITPQSSLPSGLYAVGIVAYYGNFSSVGIVFVPVQGTFSVIDFLSANFTVVMIIVAIFLGVYLLIRTQRSKKSLGVAKVRAFSGSLTKTAIMTILGLITFSLLESIFQNLSSMVYESKLRVAEAKCPGLNPGPPGRPDIYLILIDVASVGIVAIFAYFTLKDVIREHRKRAGSVGGQEPSGETEK